MGLGLVAFGQDRGMAGRVMAGLDEVAIGQYNQVGHVKFRLGVARRPLVKLMSMPYSYQVLRAWLVWLDSPTGLTHRKSRGGLGTESDLVCTIPNPPGSAIITVGDLRSLIAICPPTGPGREHMDEIDKLYLMAATIPSDIWEHVHVLRKLASLCEHVTELGTRSGVGTTALLAGRPKKLVAYDLVRYPQVDKLEGAANGRVDFRFITADVRTVTIEETDLLFIDTFHTYEQLTAELRLHGHKARRFVVLHDTVTFGKNGEDGGVGLWPAVEGYFLSDPVHWTLYEHRSNNNGLTVFARNGQWVPAPW